MYLVDFEVIRPKFEAQQKELLEWMARAHSFGAPVSRKSTIKALIGKLACSDTQIYNRGVSVADYQHEKFETMHLYNLLENHYGSGMKKRMETYDVIVDEIFQKFYPESLKKKPSDIIHVTCTGYVAPSSAQKIVSKRHWLKGTTVTHAYHMGCMASIPAMRMARGFLGHSLGPVDIVHTEICTLYMNPSLNTAQQIIAESLFADGFIKYSMVPEISEKEGLSLLALHEDIIPDTENLMEWVCEDWGMRMTLSKDVVSHIGNALPQFLKELCSKANITQNEDTLFAIHPGGPKIVDIVAKILGLKDDQISETRKILWEYGNMSSGTLPHVLELMLKTRPKGSLIVGLAFGPGLTLTGVVLKKV